MNKLLMAEVVQSERIADLLKVTQEHTRQFEKQAEKSAAFDERGDRLVLSMGTLIEGIPTSSLTQ